MPQIPAPVFEALTETLPAAKFTGQVVVHFSAGVIKAIVYPKEIKA